MFTEMERTADVFYIGGFYVSRALQNSGLGTLAMREVEVLTGREYGARVVTLNTSTREADADEGWWRAMGRERPRVTRREFCF